MVMYKLDIRKEFEKMRRRMDDLTNSFFPDFGEKRMPLLGQSTDKSFLRGSFKTPAVDIFETNKEVVAKIEVPGVKKEDIKLEVKDGMLNLKAEQKIQKEDTGKNKDYHRLERRYCGFLRSFSLPAEVDEKNVKASCRDGILEVRMTKKKVLKKDMPKYIDIK